MKAPLHIRELNRARDWYNPLRGLDIQRVVRLLEEGERGRYSELQKLNRMTEKRHPTLRALKHRRLGALKKLDWDIKIPDILPAGVSEAQAKAQQKLLRSRYELIENLPQAIEHLALATFRGFAHLEFHRQGHKGALPVVRLNPVPQWHWLRDSQDFGVWRYDAEARGHEANSAPVDLADFIIREVDDPLYEVALLCFLRRNLAKKNWTAFQEDYALPSIFAMLGENTPLDKVKEWLEIMKQVTGNTRGALPPGSNIETLDMGQLDGVQFDNFIKAEDSDLVLAGTSGKLTMLTAATGMNDGQADVHEATFNELAVAEAAEISALFQAQFDKPLLAEEFPSQPVVAYFQLAAKDEEDVAALADQAVKWSQAGFEMDDAEMSEKSGLKLKRKAAAMPPETQPGSADPAKAEVPPFKNRAQAAGREARFLARSQADLTAADQAVLQPLLERAAALDAITDPVAYEAAYRQLMADLPALEQQVLGDAATAPLEAAFEEIVGTALVSGAIEAAEAKNQKAEKTQNKAPGRDPAPKTRENRPDAS